MLMVTGLAAQPVVYLVDQPQRRPAGCSRRSVLIIKSSLQSLVDRTTVLPGCSQLLHPNLCVEQSARFRHGVNVAANVQATPEDCTVREKLLNTGCF